MKNLNKAYELAKEQYANLGVDTDKVLKKRDSLFLIGK